MVVYSKGMNRKNQYKCTFISLHLWKIINKKTSLHGAVWVNEGKKACTTTEGQQLIIKMNEKRDELPKVRHG